MPDSTVVGIDISKTHLDTHMAPAGKAARFTNDSAGFDALIAWIDQPVRSVVYEPTGPWHRAFEEALLKAGLPLARANPLQARRFAQAMGQRAKTDAVDARVLAQMGTALHLRPTEASPPTRRALEELQGARDALVTDRTAARNRQKHLRHPLLKQQSKASGESHRRAGGTACGAGASQPAHGSRLPAQGGLPIAVELRVAVLGRTVPRPLVHPDDALAARTDEGCCPHGALAPRPDPELVPSPGAVLQWRCRRLQREGQSDHQTGVWVPHLRGTGSLFVSRTWRPARTRTHPQILLTRPRRVDTREPSQLQVEPPVCRIERARPDACRSLYWRSTAQTPHGASIGGWTAEAQVLFRCSKHWDPSEIPSFFHMKSIRRNPS